jgi:hypothetical protein
LKDLLDENIAIEDMVYPIIHLKVMILKWPWHIVSRNEGTTQMDKTPLKEVRI